MLFQHTGQYTPYDPAARKTALRCPNCLKVGTLDPVGVNDLVTQPLKFAFGARRCPSPQCGQHIFIFWDQAGRALTSFPPERIDFDANDIPDLIKRSLLEAIACHSVECYGAAALMVRRTLEELAKDKGATGKNLKDRIADLDNKVVLPKELLDALDNIRLLGNDAAHVESNDYAQVGREEVEIAVEFTKEVLKAVYQYASLLKRLTSLKKSSP